MNNIPDSERMLLDFDGWLGTQPEDRQAQLRDYIDTNPDPVGAKRGIAARFAVAESTGIDPVEVDDKWDLVRGGFAAQKGGDWLSTVNDENAFHSRLVQEAQFRRDERQLIFGPDDEKAPDATDKRSLSLVKQVEDAAFSGGAFADAFAQWQGAAVVSKGWRADRHPAHEAVAREVYDRTAATVAKVKPIAEEAFAKLAADRGVGEGPADFIPFELFRGLNSDEKNAAFRLISDKAKTLKSDKSRTQAFGEGIGRGFENLAMGVALNPLAMSFLYSRKFAEGDPYLGDDPLAYYGSGGDVRKPEYEAGIKGVFGIPRKMTAEEAEALNSKKDALGEDVKTMQTLRAIAMGEIDPTNKTGGYLFQKAVMPVADSAALISGMAASGGMTLFAATGQYTNEQFKRLTDAGMDNAEAMKIAADAGVAQAALDKLGFEFLRGVPAVNNALKQFTLGRSAPVRFVAAFAGTTLAEGAIELVQDHIIPALAQDMLTANPQFDVDWMGSDGVWMQAAKAAPETFLGMLLLSAAGGAFQTFSDSQHTRMLSQSKAAMTLAGYSDAQIELIQQQPIAERGRLLAQFAPDKAPTGAEKDALIERYTNAEKAERAEYVEKLKAEAGDASDALDYAVRVTRRQGSGWTVTTESGKNLVVDSAEAARRIRQDLAQASSQREADTLVALVDEWHGQSTMVDSSHFNDASASYRVIVGDAAFNDILESGMIRTNSASKGGTSLKDRIAARPTLFPSFSRGAASMEYAGANPNHYIIVTHDASLQPSKAGRHGKGTTMFPTNEAGEHLDSLPAEKTQVWKHLGDGKYKLVYGKENAQRQTTFTGETATSDGASITYKRDGKITREITDEKTLETLRREAEIVASQTGGEAVNVIVNGSNQTFRMRVADAASQVVQRLEINRSASSVLTFLHESMESNWRAGMQDGTLTRESTRKAVASIAGAFNVNFTNAENRDFAKRVLRVADGKATDDELRETVSELAVADVIGRRKDGGKFEIGSVSRAISDAIQRAADESAIAGLSKLQAFIRAAKTFFRGVLGTVAAIRKAKQKDGKLAEDWEAFMHKLTGTSAQTQYDAGRVEDLQGLDPDYVPPTAEQEAAGIAFSVSKAGIVATAERSARNALSEWEKTLPDSVPQWSEGSDNTANEDWNLNLRFGGLNEIVKSFKPVFDVLDGTLEWQSARTGSQYISGTIVNERDDSGEIVDSSRFKITMRDHPVSQSRSAEFGANTKVIRVDSMESVRDVVKGTYRVLDGLLEVIAPYQRWLNENATGATEAAPALDSRQSPERSESPAPTRAEDVRIANRATEATSATIRGEIGNSGADVNTTLSLSPSAHVELLQRQVDAQLKRDPERRRKLAKAAGDKLQALQFAWETDRVNERGVKTRALVEQRSPASLSKEQAFREAVRREELEAEVYAVYGEVLENESLGQLWGAGPVMEYLSNPTDKLHGRLMSKSQALKSGKFSESNGDYDGIDGIPRVVFGGSLMPDQVAQELFEAGILKDASVDALWDTIRNEIKSAARWKGFLKTAKEGLKKAKRQAHEEAAEWRREQDELQKEDWNPKARLLRDMRALDAVISVLPPELRSKVGGFIKLAELTTDKARMKEIERRMKKLGGIVEDYLKKESIDAIDALIEKAQPSTGPGEKPKGKITVEGHRVFSAVEAVRGMTTEQVDAERARLATEIEKRITKGEDVIDLLEQEQILEMFGGLDEKTAAEVDSAASWLDKVYRTGRNAWRMMEEARLAEVADLKEQTIAAIGAASKSGTQEQKKNAANLKTFAESASFQLLSFTQVLESVVGAGHPLVARWSRAAREATNQRTDAILGANARFEKAARDAFGGVSKLEMSKRLWEMANNYRIRLDAFKPTKKEKKSAPIKTIMQFADGSVNPVDLGFTADEAKDLIDQMNDPANARKKKLSVERIAPPEADGADYTESEVMALTMLAKQAQYLPNLEKHGYTAAVIEAAEAALSDAAKAIRTHLLKEYADGYAPLAKVFREMFGIDLPSVANYSPAAFMHAGETRDVDPFGGMVSEGGFRAGFLKSRKEHLAAPRIENALQTFQGHVAQTEHWRAFAPLVRELRAVFGSVEVKDSILSNRGRGLDGAMQAWVKAIEQNGLQQRAYTSFIDPAFRLLTGRQATLTLAWKAGTLIKQSLAALSSAARLPSGVWLRGLSRVLSGKIDVSAIRNSPMIQRRLESGFSPEVRAAMVSLFNGKPSVWSQFVQAGMEKIGEVDAFFTSIGTAIAYDYHFNEGLKNGMSEEAAREMALVEAEDNLGRTAQPTELIDRSLYELGMSPAERVSFMFASNARKDAGLLISAFQQFKAGKISKAEFTQTVAITWLAVSFGNAILSAWWRDANDDDDEAWLDWEHWSPVDIARNTLLNPVGGLPLIGALYNTFIGFGPNDPFKPVKQMKNAVAGIIDGDKSEPVEKTVRRVVDVLNGAAVFVPKLEGAAVGANIVEQAFNLADNLVPDTESEAAKKEKAAIARERKAAREAK